MGKILKALGRALQKTKVTGNMRNLCWGCDLGRHGSMYDGNCPCCKGGHR